MRTPGRHVRCKLRGGGPIASTPAERRLLAKTVLTHGRPYDLAAFSLPDTHIHLWALCSEARARQLQRNLESGLKQRLRLTAPFVEPYNEPVRDQDHAKALARYILQNHDRHGVLVDRLREATNLPDLLGLRPLGGFTAANLRRALPRLTRTQLLEWLDVPGLAPYEGPAPLEEIVEAALRAAALPHLRSKRWDVVAVRRVVVTLASPWYGAAALAPALGVTPRRVFGLRQEPADPLLLRATLLQLDLARQIAPDAASGLYLPNGTKGT